MENIIALLLLAGICMTSIGFAAEDSYVKHFPDSLEVLKTLKTEHPRLFISPEKMDDLRALINKDPFVKKAVKNLFEQADGMLSEPPVEFKIIGPRLLQQSRRCLQRVSVLAFCYHLNGNLEYVQRAEKELLTAAAFPHWNPRHFLDVAEMSNAFGIGYDWLYHVLPDSSKKIIREALVEKGLKPGLNGFRRRIWWAQSEFNWNQVCNGGLTVGALAVADEYPEITSAILSKAIKNITLALASYGTDGGWGEGPGYWAYATNYTVFMFAALESALGTDFGLSDAPAMAKTGLFPIFNTGPTEQSFNYADARAAQNPMFPFFWLSKRFGCLACAEEQNKRLKQRIDAKQPPEPWDLLWYQPPPKPQILPLNMYYPNIEVMSLRGDWQDSNSFYIAFKGGDNRTNHAHLDIGTFVLDAYGQRWAADIGPDDYNLPGYWDVKEGGKRWQYFRLNNTSHNTLTLNGDLQRIAAKAPIFKRELESENPFGVIDLSEAYQPHASRVWRGIKLINKKSVLIQDEIQWNGTQKDWVWNLTTQADIQTDGNTAALASANRNLVFTILSPESAAFDTLSAFCEPPQNPNKGFRRLVIRGKETGGMTMIVVLIADQQETRDLNALEEW